MKTEEFDLDYEKNIAKELILAINGEQDLEETIRFIQNSHKIKRIKEEEEK